MRTLVTGGAGFLGSHLCEFLARQGHEVIAFDNLSTGSSSKVNGLVQLVVGDVQRLAVSGPFDRVYNLACPASPVQYQRRPVETLKTNVLGMLRVLDLAIEEGARVLQASTSEVYGDPEEAVQSEGYLGRVNPVGPRACYDEGKRCAETLCMDYHRTFGVDVRIARIFNTYGPRMERDDGRVISNFIVQALEGRPITVYGSGAQTRSFCFVDDMVQGLVRVMEAGEPGGIYNLGNPEEVTILDLAKEVELLLGRALAVEWLPLPQDDPRQRCPDISRAISRLGWQPKVNLREGLRRTIDYFKVAR